MTRVDTRRELDELLNTHASRIREFGVEQIGVFGSFARGEQTDTSDIDLMVVFAPGKKTYRNFIDLAYFLEDNAGRRIELLTPEALSDRIRDRVLSQVDYVPLAA